MRGSSWTPEGDGDNKSDETAGGAYAPAVMILRGVQHAWTPARVLKTVAKTARRMCECVDAHAKRKSVIGADDVLLLFSFLLAKAQVPNIHARVGMCDALMTPVQRSSADGYYIATMTAALELLRSRVSGKMKDILTQGGDTPRGGRSVLSPKSSSLDSPSLGSEKIKAPVKSNPSHDAKGKGGRDNGAPTRTSTAVVG